MLAVEWDDVSSKCGEGPGSLSAARKPKARRSLALWFYGMTQQESNGFATQGGKKPQSQRHSINISERTELFNYDEFKYNCYWFNSGTSAVYDIPV